MRNMDRVIRNKFIVMILIFSLCFYNASDAKAAQKRKEIRHTFRMNEVGDLGAPLFVVVDVFSVASETYSYTSKNVTYKKRSVYAYFKEITALSYYKCGVSPIRHINSSGSQIKTFGWKHEDGLFPNDTCFIYSKYNDTKVTYSRSNKNKAQWTVGVSAPDTLQKAQVVTGTISLYFSSK